MKTKRVLFTSLAATLIVVLALVVGAVVLRPLDVAAIPAGATTNAVQEIGSDGITPTYSAADAQGNAFANNGATFVHIKNIGAVTITATFVTPLMIGRFAVADLAIIIPPTSEKVIGPFIPAVFNELSGASKGDCTVTWSSPISVTLGVFRLGE